MAEDVHITNDVTVNNKISLTNTTASNECDDTKMEANNEINKLSIELEFMHDENERMKLIYDKEKESLRAECDDRVLQKEIELHATLQKLETMGENSTLQKLDTMKEEYYNNLQHSEKKLTDAYKLIAKQEAEIKEKDELLDRANETKQTVNDNTHKLEELRSLLECEKDKNLLLKQTIQDKTMIIEKSSLAIDTLKEVDIMKNQIITKLRTEIQIEKLTTSNRPSAHKVVDVTSNKSDVENKVGEELGVDAEQAIDGKGTDESCEFIKIHGKNGVIMNGFLLWANIQRTIRTENAWKEDALEKFLKEEITEAKDCLWRISGDKIPSPIKKWQGALKSTSILVGR